MARKIFEQARMTKIRKSAFDLSHEHKTTTEFSKLTPVLNMEVVPGDQFAVNSEILVRMAPTTAPIMHRVDVFIHHFFVPNRIIWDGWEDFIFPKDDSGVIPELPKTTITDENKEFFGAGTLGNHLGLPDMSQVDLSQGSIEVNELPFRAYYAIYNDYYRDQNLEDELPVGSEILYRAWEKDYFTSALPFAQKGPAVGLPISGDQINYKSQAELIVTDTNELQGSSQIGQTGWVELEQQRQDGSPVQPVGIDNVESFDGSFTIEDLRRSARLQEWLEKAARAGTRYKEGIKAFFGMNVGDARLDRPEYLGGGKQPISISEVLNTAGNIKDPQGQPDEEIQPNVQGDMAGHGIAVGGRNNFKYTVKEHGHIISIMSIMPKPAYQQGIERNWTRTDRYDYYWEQFANIGEQEVKNKEIYIDSDPTQRELTFGYQQRYAEYKYTTDKVTGDFATSLDFWHLGRKFQDQPVLNETFIKPNVQEFDRIFAVDAKTTGADQFWCQIYHDIKARRPMPYFSTPRL